MAVPNLGGFVYAAKQSAKGSAASTAAFAHAVTGGKILNVPREYDKMEAATSLRVAPGDIAKPVVPALDFESYAYPKSLGLWLLGFMGTDTVTGSGPYQHTFTLQGSPPYLTVWQSRLNAAEKQSISDLRLTDLGLSWDGTDPLKLKATGAGITPTLSGANWGTPTNDETSNVSTFLPIGGSFKLDALGNSPATVLASAGSVEFSSGATPITVSSQLTPGDVLPSIIEGKAALTMYIDDFGTWRKANTGSTSGTTLATLAGQFGALEFNFIEANGTATLKVTLNRARIKTNLPDVDPEAGPAQIDVEADIYGVTTTDIQIVLTNGIATY
jgi:hypothetical protein